MKKLDVATFATARMINRKINKIDECKTAQYRILSDGPVLLLSKDKHGLWHCLKSDMQQCFVGEEHLLTCPILSTDQSEWKV